MSRPSGTRLACAPLVALSMLLLGAETFGQRTARAIRTETPPTIDGDLTDAVWEQAIPLEDLYQVDPLEGVPPSERTEIRILYDTNTIYFGIRLFDREPDKIIAATRERDASLEADDRIEMVLDTFLDKRNAFFFQMNPSGSKGDALITDNGADFNKPWDGIWEGKSRVDALGWAIEMAIPFKTLNFKEGLDTWGFNLTRYIGRRTERARWNNYNRNVSLFTIAEAGELSGIEGIDQGIGLDVVPFFTTNWEKDRTGGGDSDTFLEPGVDVFYKITPNLTLSLTANTDFAETEVDERQINLTRFPLFFPEQRDFFLQDAGNFTFGNQGNRGSGTRFRPFFSRRIGLVEGEEIPIEFGGKLTGRTGEYNVGVLDTLTGDESVGNGDDRMTVESENLFVARISRNLGEQSRVGVIVTDGDPEGGDNSVFGVDARYRTTSFRGDKALQGTLWALHSETDGASNNETAYGASLSYPNDIWSWSATFMEVQKNFDAALGFVPREDIRQYNADITYEPRIDEYIRSLEFSVETEAVFDTDDVLETWETEVQPLGILWESGDRLGFEFEHIHDELREDFEIVDDVFIDDGAYDYFRGRIEIDTAEKRKLSGRTGTTGGSYYDGTRWDWWLNLAYRTGPLFTTRLEYRENYVDLDDGDFTTRIAGMRTSFSFTPDLSWNTFTQWDNQSDTIGVNSRLRYIIRPGRDVYLVFNQVQQEDNGSFYPRTQDVAFKIGYTFRF